MHIKDKNSRYFRYKRSSGKMIAVAFVDYNVSKNQSLMNTKIGPICNRVGIKGYFFTVVCENRIKNTQVIIDYEIYL